MSSKKLVFTTFIPVSFSSMLDVTGHALKRTLWFGVGCSTPKKEERQMDDLTDTYVLMHNF